MSKEEEYVLKVIRDFETGKGYLSGFFQNFQGGPWVQQFENAFARYVGAKHAIAVSSGTAALHMALEAVKLPHQQGSPVLTSPMTFVASASSIFMARQFPVFCDISPRTLNMDPSTYGNSLSQSPPSRKMPTPEYVVAVNLLGHPVNLSEVIQEFPEAPIIEDCAQSLGAKYQGKMTGTSTIGCYSFQQTKTLTTLGEGGMVVTNYDAIADKCRQIRNHGEKYMKGRYLGYNYRMTEAAAAYGLAQLERLPETMKRQIACAEIVRKNLPDGLAPLPVESWAEPSYFIVGATIESIDSEMALAHRAKFIDDCMRTLGFKAPQPGRVISPGYTELIPDLPYFKRHSTYYNWEFPVARHMMKKMVWFDIHRFTTPEETERRMDLLKGVKLGSLMADNPNGKPRLFQLCKGVFPPGDDGGHAEEAVQERPEAKTGEKCWACGRIVPDHQWTCQFIGPRGAKSPSDAR